MELSNINVWGAPTLEGFDERSIQEGQRISGKSNRQYVRFYKKKFVEVYTVKAKINEKTGHSTPLETGTREVEKLMVHIVTPGDKNEVDDVACDFHKRDHWAAYKAFMDGKTIPLGTSIEECSYVSPGVALDLKYYNCHTEEQLAEAADHLCSIIANGFELREFARARVKAKQTDVAPQVQEMKLELSKAQAEAAKMAALMADMKAQMEVMQASILGADGQPVVSEKKRAGRPKKTPVDAFQGE